VVFDSFVYRVVADSGGHLRVKNAHVIELGALILGQLEGTDNLSKIILSLVSVESRGESSIFEVRG